MNRFKFLQTPIMSFSAVVSLLGAYLVFFEYGIYSLGVLTRVFGAYLFILLISYMLKQKGFSKRIVVEWILIVAYTIWVIYFLYSIITA